MKNSAAYYYATDRLILWIVCLYILLKPFYFFSSGLPQPADMIVAFGCGIFILQERFRRTFTLPVLKYALAILGLVALTNIAYWIYFTFFEEVANSMLVPPFYYLFNVGFMAMFAYIQTSNNESKHVELISISIIATLMVQTFLALLGIQGNIPEEESCRDCHSIFFNNPNQLAYFALLMITLFCILPSKYRRHGPTLTFTFLLSAYLIIHSGSRAAFGGLVLLVCYWICTYCVKLSKRVILGSVTGLAVVLILLLVFLRRDWAGVADGKVGQRLSVEFFLRGYDRIYKDPQYLFYGAGEGKDDRFELNSSELHSAFGTMLFSYGFLGLFLFVGLIYLSVRNDKFGSFMLILPLLFYNMAHNGLRNPLFWAVLAALYINVNEQNKEGRQYKLSGGANDLEKEREQDIK